MEIPQCVGTVEETVAIIRQDRVAWLAQQATATLGTRGLSAPGRLGCNGPAKSIAILCGEVRYLGMVADRFHPRAASLRPSNDESR